MIRRLGDLPSAPHAFQRAMQLPAGYVITCNSTPIYGVDTTGEADEMIAYLKDRDHCAITVPPLTRQQIRDGIEALWG